MAKRGAHARANSPVVVLILFVLTGFVFVTASISADGDDLRPAGGDVASLLQDRAKKVEEQRAEANRLRAEIDALSAGVSDSELDTLRKRLDALEPPTGLTAVTGPGIKVTLTDAPEDRRDPNIDGNIQVVHQQDIQAFVNALWAGGAEAMSLQGQRIVATTGIVCVGSVVILDGVPYSPPYVIEAIGDTSGMQHSIETSSDTVTYARYVEQYQLGLKVEPEPKLKVRAYANPVSLTHAKVPQS